MSQDSFKFPVTEDTLSRCRKYVVPEPSQLNLGSGPSQDNQPHLKKVAVLRSRKIYHMTETTVCLEAPDWITRQIILHQYY